jgi:hypothetical protein
MIYLIHLDTYDTCTCETEGTAVKAEARGFVRVSAQEWCEYRQANDEQRLAELRRATEPPAPVQHTAPLGGAPKGFTLYFV